MSRIAFLGLGGMGSRMAGRLAMAGYPLTVWDRSDEQRRLLAHHGAHMAETPRAAVKDADVVMTMLSDDTASRAVWLDAQTGALAALGDDVLAIESGTLSSAWIHELSQALGSSNFLDAPVSGSRSQAETGQLVYLVGGQESAFRRARPILKTMGSVVHHVGGNGQGAQLKLALNALLGTQMTAMAEILGFLAKAGVDPDRALDIISSTPIASPAVCASARLMLARNFAPQLSLDLLEKDFRYLLEAAGALEAELPTSQAVHQVLAIAQARGFGRDNISALVRLFDWPQANSSLNPSGTA
ncbi:NAD(P)-dependent oxidoreductase [Craterilacuibacter sp. RT1T]|uniref:NAD(P)-dependent oxidoreductase n=1 Tax=Craterilacuibacter sp. RT1T TaxID=2942211 RepID=UPI0020BD7D90|nr:NAD(P)-dependent oxidoreductase [Craterilacuibacter sp. RT1T]MCL6263534.1 NAD(P)-dependent oxidoreductase [Craterilacuibacter sp. RT1T]